jgi:hypothetical protein
VVLLWLLYNLINSIEIGLNAEIMPSVNPVVCFISA